MPLVSKLMAEVFGTFCLVFIGCASVVFMLSEVHTSGVWYPVVAMTFGLAVMTMAYSIGHISGCHLNPAVTLGLWAAKRFQAREIIPYIIAQLIGAIFGALVLYWIASGLRTFSIGNFACTGYGATYSPAGYATWACFIAEVIFTGVFIFIIVGSTSDAAPKGFAPIAIGLGLTMIHLALIPITGCSLNPARSTGTAVVLAIFKTGPDKYWAVGQLWLFWVAPMLGGLLGGGFYYFISAMKTNGAGEKPVKAATVDEKAFVDPNEAERFSIGSPRPAPKPTEKKPH